MARAEPRLGFSVRIELRPGMTEREARRLLHALQEYFCAHGLVAEGTQLQWLVYSHERSLSQTDQVDLLDWLVDQPGVSEVLLMPLTAGGTVRGHSRTGSWHCAPASFGPWR